MNRLDYYDITPMGMDAYLSAHGRHFSKPMLEWALGMMRNKNGQKGELLERKQLDEILKANNVTLQNQDGYYDPLYVWAMGRSDYFNSSIIDDKHLALFVHDYCDDVDGNPTRAFDEFYANCIAKGIDVPWEDMI